MVFQNEETGRPPALAENQVPCPSAHGSGGVANALDGRGKQPPGDAFRARPMGRRERRRHESRSIESIDSGRVVNHGALLRVAAGLSAARGAARACSTIDP